MDGAIPMMTTTSVIIAGAEHNFAVDTPEKDLIELHVMNA
jgi:hypothetical protein